MGLVPGWLWQQHCKVLILNMEISLLIYFFCVMCHTAPPLNQIWSKGDNDDRSNWANVMFVRVVFAINCVLDCQDRCSSSLMYFCNRQYGTFFGDVLCICVGCSSRSIFSYQHQKRLWAVFCVSVSAMPFLLWPLTRTTLLTLLIHSSLYRSWM
jgi:hypothetical protein